MNRVESPRDAPHKLRAEIGFQPAIRTNYGRRSRLAAADARFLPGCAQPEPEPPLVAPAPRFGETETP